MKIKVELLKGYISDVILKKLDDMEIDATRIADTKAIMMLGEIYAILQNKYMEPFDMIGEISRVYNENNLDGVWWDN